MTLLLVELWENRLKGITDLVEKNNLEYVIARPYKEKHIPLGSYSGIILSGGKPCLSKINEYPFLTDVISFTKKAVEDDIPVFGICLGHQILATAIGGKVAEAKKPEAGFCYVNHNNSELLSGLRNPLYTFQYHYDEVISLPNGTEIYASSPACKIQAFKVKDKNCWGVQFHPEIDYNFGKKILVERAENLAKTGIDIVEAVGSRQKYSKHNVDSVILGFLAKT
jgi:GMP synthase-like glutamine amidotransferase